MKYRRQGRTLATAGHILRAKIPSNSRAGAPGKFYATAQLMRAKILRIVAQCLSMKPNQLRRRQVRPRLQMRRQNQLRYRLQPGRAGPFSQRVL